MYIRRLSCAASSFFLRRLCILSELPLQGRTSESVQACRFFAAPFIRMPAWRIYLQPRIFLLPPCPGIQDSDFLCKGLEPQRAFVTEALRHGKAAACIRNAAGSEGCAALLQQVMAISGQPDGYYPPWTSPEQSIMGIFTERLKCFAISELGKVEIAAL